MPFFPSSTSIEIQNAIWLHSFKWLLRANRIIICVAISILAIIINVNIGFLFLLNFVQFFFSHRVSMCQVRVNVIVYVCGWMYSMPKCYWHPFVHTTQTHTYNMHCAHFLLLIRSLNHMIYILLYVFALLLSLSLPLYPLWILLILIKVYILVVARELCV